MEITMMNIDDMNDRARMAFDADSLNVLRLGDIAEATGDERDEVAAENAAIKLAATWFDGDIDEAYNWLAGLVWSLAGFERA
jgi:hypothetical protein